MRSDMAKVVTERPRYGHHNKSLKTGGRIGKDHFEDEDHGSARYPVSRSRQHGWDAKEFSDLIGPLRRYLRSQVGRPWNKIHSELSKILKKRSLTGLHIWSHINSEVQQHVIIIDGKLYDDRAVFSRRHEIKGLYVHPRTGILRWKAKKETKIRTKKISLLNNQQVI